MSYGWIFGVTGLVIVWGLILAAWAAERHDRRAWWREPRNEREYIEIGRRRWR